MMEEREMNTIQKKESKPGLSWCRKPIPTPGKKDVLVKIKKTSICGTDAHIYSWDQWAASTIKPPMVIGHEFVGDVVGFGKDVRSVSIGDSVSGEGHLFCGGCDQCLDNKRHLCEVVSGIGIDRDGAFAEFVCFPEENVWKRPAVISEEIAAIMDPFGNAVNAIYSYPVLRKTILIFGAGPIGIMVGAIAKRLGASDVVMIDRVPYRLQLAKKMGVDSVINSEEEDIEEALKALGVHNKVDIAFEVSGSVVGFNTVVRQLRKAGKLVLIGVFSEPIQVDMKPFLFKGLEMKYIFGREIFRTWDQGVDLLKQGLDLSPIITHRFKSHDFEKGFQLMAEKQCGKIILEWS